MIKTFERVNGIKTNYEFKARRPGDLAVSFADVSKVKKNLNWQAEKNLENMRRGA